LGDLGGPQAETSKSASPFKKTGKFWQTQKEKFEGSQKGGENGTKRGCVFCEGKRIKGPGESWKGRAKRET